MSEDLMLAAFNTPDSHCLLRIGLLPATFAVCIGGLAQCQTPVIKTDVRQVLVPVVVTDKRGHHILGLRADDFEVSEDGARQKILAFSSSSEASLTINPKVSGTALDRSMATGNAAPVDPKRTYLICVDTLHSAFSNFGRVVEALKKFFLQEQSDDSQYALAALGRTVRVVQDSTRDTAKILEVVQSKEFLKAIRDSESITLVRDTQQFSDQMAGDYCRLCACEAYGTNTDSPGCPGAAGRLRATLLSVGQRTLFLDQDFFRGLNELVQACASMPTVSTIVFISDGFNRFPGRELYGIMDGYGPRDRTFQFNPHETTDALQTVLKLAVRYNVRFYTLDSRGLYASPGTSSFDASHGGIKPEKVDRNQMSVAQENTDALAELAHQTGGTFFENSNDLLKGIRRAFDDSREYYLLAYSSTNKAMDGTFRKITVDVKKHGLAVKAKAGYWAVN